MWYKSNTNRISTQSSSDLEYGICILFNSRKHRDEVTYQPWNIAQSFPVCKPCCYRSSILSNQILIYILPRYIGLFKKTPNWVEFNICVEIFVIYLKRQFLKRMHISLKCCIISNCNLWIYSTLQDFHHYWGPLLRPVIQGQTGEISYPKTWKGQKKKWLVMLSKITQKDFF